MGDLFIMKQYIVDAFTNKPFAGNPAAVCVMESWPSEESMMKLAMENNLSETAFIVKEEKGHHERDAAERSFPRKVRRRIALCDAGLSVYPQRAGTARRDADAAVDGVLQAVRGGENHAVHVHPVLREVPAVGSHHEGNDAYPA